MIFVRTTLLFLFLTMLTLPFTARAESHGETSGGNNVQNEATSGAPPASAQFQFQRQGVFGCNQNAAYAMSVGALSAVGGLYVPVNDAAVTLNTGYLVYKECVLDGVTKREAESATSAFVNRYIRDVISSRRFSQDLAAESLARADQMVLDSLSEKNTAPVCGAIRNPVRTALVRSYLASSRKPNESISCSLNCSEADMAALLRGDLSKCGGISGFYRMAIDPANTPAGAYYLGYQAILSRILQKEGNMREHLAYGRGLYPITQIDTSSGFTVEKVVTPAFLVAEGLAQVSSSGFRQLENATEIDQMVSALFAGLSTQLATDARGLSGLTQKIGTQPSYLDQLARESAAGLRSSAVNAGLTILTAARQVETKYLEVVTETGALLTEAINKLRAAEARCWELIIPKVEEYARNGGFCTNNTDGTTTCPSAPFSIQVATSTQFSQPIITRDIAPYAKIAADNIRASQVAVQLIDHLIAGITNTNSLDAQRLALQQLDTLVADGKLHTGNDVTQVQNQRDAVKSAVGDIVTNTLTAWGDNGDPNVGWCNVNNPNVVKMWAERWKR